MKVYRYKQEVMDNFIHVDQLEDYMPSHHVHLGDYDNYIYYAFNPDHVLVHDNDEKYDQKIFDPNNQEDCDFLKSIRTKLYYVQQQVSTTKAELFHTLDMVDLFVGIIEQDKYILDKIKEIKSKIDQIYADNGL